MVVGYHHFRKPPVENNAGAQGSLHDPTQRTPWLQLNHKFLGLPPTVSCPVTRPYDARPQRISLPCWPCNWFYDESLTNKNHNKRLLKGSKVELNPHFSVFIWARPTWPWPRWFLWDPGLHTTQDTQKRGSGVCQENIDVCSVFKGLQDYAPFRCIYFVLYMSI